MDEKYLTLKTLIVDDHMMMRTMIRQHLEAIGFNAIDTANDGYEALDKILQAHEVGAPYNLVFLDWHMPNMEGFDVLKSCREKPEFNKTAFVMLTAEQEEKNVLKAIQAGSTSYLIKPVSRSAMEKNLQQIVKWLEQQGYEFVSAPQKKTLTSEAGGKISIPDRLKAQLAPVISDGIKNIFSELFHTEIVENHQICDEMKRQLVCIGKLHQDNIVLDLRFFFKQELLHPMLANLYSPEFLQDAEVFEDAACEIVNILCGQIKAFMNKNGYQLAMSTPQMGADIQDFDDSDNLINVCFSLNHDQSFLIGLDAAHQSA